MAGFFSSTTLAVTAKGIAKFIENGGIMKLICSPRFTDEDIKTIKQTTATLENILDRRLTNEIKDIENTCINDHVKVLAWLISNQRLDIKIAIVQDENNIPLTENEILQKGIFHQKVGILEDINGNKVSFSGSDNESAFGWLNNIEEFKVFREWIPEEIEYLISDITKFNKFWNDVATRTKVISLPEAVKKELIQIAPKRVADVNLKNWYSNSISTKKIKLFDHQKNAVDNWIENNMKGLFEMATGTGKTYSALGSLKELLKITGRIAAIITCPYGHLVEQWLTEMEKFQLFGFKAYSSFITWKDEITNIVLDYNNGYRDVIIILTTHDTFSSVKFIEIIKKIKGNLLLIADEVHGLGSPERRKGLLEEYEFRLGLSATPSRWFDDEGTFILESYFGNTVFEFPLSRAITEGYLTPYEFHPHFVSLDDDELDEYRQATKKIVQEYAKNEGERSTWFDLLCINRQKIVVNARQKYEIYKNLIDSKKVLELCLVYCSPEQIDLAQTILNERGIINHRFTARETIKERISLLKRFSEGGYKVLVAMNCLDEGVDVPTTRIAIILASSGNPRQYVQRRGRILRKSPGKEYAIIHDFIVIPEVSKEIDSELFQFERKIIKRELRRYEEFAKCSINYLEALNLLYPYMKQFEVYGPEVSEND